MSLLSAFLVESAPLNVWVAARNDGVSGSGTLADPFNGSLKMGLGIGISLALIDPRGHKGVSQWY